MSRVRMPLAEVIKVSASILVGAIAGSITVTALAMRHELKNLYPNGRHQSLKKGGPFSVLHSV